MRGPRRLVPRRPLRLFAPVAGTAATVALLAGAPPAGAAPTAGGPVVVDPIRPGYPTVEREVAWTLAGSARRGGAIVVDPGYGGACGSSPRAIVREAGSRIEVRVVVSEPAPEAMIACPALAVRHPRITVPLAKPIGGRRVRGPQQQAPTPFGVVPETFEPTPGERRATVPDLRGLATGDATGVLCLNGLRGVVRGPRGRPGVRVLRQDPRAGRTLPWRFDGRSPAAERCTAAAVRDLPRVRVTVGR